MKKKKNKRFILQKIRLQATRRRYYKKKKKKKQRLVFSQVPRAPRKFYRSHLNYLYNIKTTELKKGQYIKNFLPGNLGYLINSADSPFHLKKIEAEHFNSKGHIEIPKFFSILDYPDEIYQFFKRLISALLIEKSDIVSLDYKNCKQVGLGSQVLLDIILIDYLKFIKTIKIKGYFPYAIKGENINDESVKKLIFSVGSPVNLKIKDHVFPDIVRYKLCIHDNEKETDPKKRIEQKVIDTTELADYVIECLERINKKLTSEKRDDLCTVIGETLINAEEHSTNKHRISIGYFREESIEGNHFGVFQLIILNFGRTIYEKFKSEDCPNQDIVKKMKELSSNYTKKKLFRQREFEEENLWTLYALQEGITSVSVNKYKRGNGSIRFIESFFNIKGSIEADNISKMTILSGRTEITFDGTYGIIQKIKSNGDKFRVMTFNDSGNIEDKPDNKFVSCNTNYFPGTMISARILLNDDDLKQINNK